MFSPFHTKTFVSLLPPTRHSPFSFRDDSVYMPIFTYYIYIFLNNINAGGLGAFLRVQSNKKWLDQTSLDVWSPTVHLRDIIDATGALARDLMETSSKHDMAGSRELDGQAALNKISFPSLLSSDQRGESWSWKDASTWACQQHVRAPHSPTGICRQGGEKESQDRNSGVTTPVTNSLSDSPPPPLFRAAGCWTGLQIPPSTCLLKGSAVCLTGPWRRRIGRMHRMGERRKKEPFSSTSSEKKKELDSSPFISRRWRGSCYLKSQISW